jgi:chemotaxis protein methyltransferase CheR
MLTNEEFRLFRNLIYEESGIYLKESRKDFLENRLVKRMNVTGMNSPYWYYRFLTERKKAELLILLDLLTINETSFFRNKPQLELFKNVVLPDVMNSRGVLQYAPLKKLRIWSAGCSTGEEPYTIAMIVMDAMNNAPPYPPLSATGGFAEAKSRGGRGCYDDWDIKIFASDISLTAIETASRGKYDGEKVRAVVDGYYIDRYFEKVSTPLCHSHESGNPEKKQKTGFPLTDCGNDAICSKLRSREGIFSEQKLYKVKAEVKKLVIFDFHNLKNENGLADLDVIFCRNVMIYFDIDEQKRLVNKFYKSLKPGGYLFLGHAESLHGMGTDFQFIYEDMGTAYRKPLTLCHSREGGNPDAVPAKLVPASRRQGAGNYYI